MAVFHLQRLMHILLVTLAVPALLLAAGMLLPAAWHAERSVVIHAPASGVFPYLNNLKLWREWAVWNQGQSGAALEYNGADAGVGATVRWIDEDGRAVLKLTQSEPNRLIVYAILRQGGEWRTDGQLTLTPEGQNTRVAWRTAGPVGRNPIARYSALFQGHRIGEELGESLERLRHRLETNTAEPTARPKT